ncbi:SgcJ/EcaC family oxidoreductase [Pseudonocardia benzenivorans]
MSAAPRTPVEIDASGTDAEIVAVLTRLAAAWRAADAAAYGAEFTEDATYVVFNGIVLRGRAAIADAHAMLWKGPLAGSRMDPPGPRTSPSAGCGPTSRTSSSKRGCDPGRAAERGDRSRVDRVVRVRPRRRRLAHRRVPEHPSDAVIR